MILNQPSQNIGVGASLKSAMSSSLSLVEHTPGVLADIVVTIRSTVELVHSALQEPILDQRIDYANKAQKSIKSLVASGMTKSEAHNYLQIPSYISTTTKINKDI